MLNLIKIIMIIIIIAINGYAVTDTTVVLDDIVETMSPTELKYLRDLLDSNKIDDAVILINLMYKEHQVKKSMSIIKMGIDSTDYIDR